MNTELKVLLVEDEVLIRKYTGRLIQSIGCQLIGEASSGEQALELIESLQPDLIILDINLRGEIDGIETARRINQDRGVKIIFVSGYDFANKVNSLNIPNVLAYLQKPVRRQELLPVLEKIK